jgi:hypothetical protein
LADRFLAVRQILDQQEFPYPVGYFLASVVKITR